MCGRMHFPPLITVWHNEPDGQDSLTVCDRNSHWQWHIHHWSIQVHSLQSLRRRVLTRCAWCGGRHTKRDPINTGTGGWNPKESPWWRGEIEIAHSDCYTVLNAHRICLCDNPVLSQGDYGQCAFCGNYRAWRQAPTVLDRYLASLPKGERIPDGKREWLKSEWAKLRAERTEQP
jgi:hypothetical protein